MNVAAPILVAVSCVVSVYIEYLLIACLIEERSEVDLAKDTYTKVKCVANL